jgi:hypothetical protein
MATENIEKGDQGMCNSSHNHESDGPSVARFAHTNANHSLINAVSWQWSGGRPSGEVAEVKEQGEVIVESNRGNTIKRTANGPEDPAVHVAREGNDVVKNAHELAVEEKANGTKEDQQDDSTGAEEKKHEEKGAETNGEVKAREKHAREEKLAESNGVTESESKEAKDVEINDGLESSNTAEVETEENAEKSEEPAAKKQKTGKEDKPVEEDGDKRARGRPKKSNSQSSKTSAKKKEPKSAATEDGKPRRSARFQT